MRDDICTIPVSEIFEVNDGCPICRMRDTVETRLTDYILGDAMMEPDVRISTNKMGFCEKHYEKLLSHKGRLQLALMLQTHLAEINNSVFSDKIGTKKSAEAAAKIYDCCFLCEKIEWGMSRLIDTVYRCYENESDFRTLFDGQPLFCFAHYKQLLSGANKKTMRKHYSDFCDSLSRIAGDYSRNIYDNISQYCALYDYRSDRSPEKMNASKNSVEQGVNFLTGKTGK